MLEFLHCVRIVVQRSFVANKLVLGQDYYKLVITLHQLSKELDMSDKNEQYVTADAEKHSLSATPDAGGIALGVFEEVREGSYGVDDRALLWKLDLRLMPLM